MTALPPSFLPAHLDFERSPQGLAGIAVDAGLQVVSARELTWQWQITPDDLWAGVSGGVATVGQTYLAQDPTTRTRVEEEFRARAQAQASADVLQFVNRAALVVARR